MKREGKRTTELEYKVENRKLGAKHHIVLDQLDFGAATQSNEKVDQMEKISMRQIDPERVFLTERESGKSSTAGIARMELRLE